MSKNTPDKDPPSRTIEGRENQLISLAVEVAEKQMREGTASSQIVTHFLKLATTREDLEKEKLAYETELVKAKTEAMKSTKRIEELYEEAITAMKSYQGYEDLDDEELL